MHKKTTVEHVLRYWMRERGDREKVGGLKGGLYSRTDINILGGSGRDREKVGGMIEGICYRLLDIVKYLQA